MALLVMGGGGGRGRLSFDSATQAKSCQLLKHLGANSEAVQSDWQTPMHVVAKTKRVAYPYLSLLPLPFVCGVFSGDLQKKRIQPIDLAGGYENARLCCLVIDGGRFWRHVETLRALWMAGGRLEARDSIGRTPLHVAVLNWRMPMVRMMHSLSVHLETPDNIGRTAIHMASLHGQIELLELLHELGADAKARNRLGWTALHCAAWNGQAAAIQCLARMGPIDLSVRNNDNETALQTAARNGKLDVISALHELGAPLEDPTTSGMTTMHIAAQHGQVDLIELLVELGADIEVTNKDGWTAMHFASWSGKLASLSKLTVYWQIWELICLLWITWAGMQFTALLPKSDRYKDDSPYEVCCFLSPEKENKTIGGDMYCGAQESKEKVI
eukprot:gene4048-5021_t